MSKKRRSPDRRLPKSAVSNRCSLLKRSASTFQRFNVPAACGGRSGLWESHQVAIVVPRLGFLTWIQVMKSEIQLRKYYDNTKTSP